MGCPKLNHPDPNRRRTRWSSRHLISPPYLPISPPYLPHISHASMPPRISPASPLHLPHISPHLPRISPHQARLISWGRSAAVQASVESERWAVGVFDQVERDATARTILAQVVPTGPGASLTLPYISTTSPLQLPYISATSRLYLAYISATSRLTHEDEVAHGRQAARPRQPRPLPHLQGRYRGDIGRYREIQGRSREIWGDAPCRARPRAGRGPPP